MDEQGVTLGEVHRLCLEIKVMVREQNGRVRKLEEQAIEDRTKQAADARQIKLLWSGGAVLAGFGFDWLKHKLGF